MQERRFDRFLMTAIANERLSVNHAGQVVLKLKTPYRLAHAQGKIAFNGCRGQVVVVGQLAPEL